jgi:hypothetical protein
MDAAIHRELDLIKGEIAKLAAETAALQAIIVQLAKRLSLLDPVLANAISKSFDEAVHLAESVSRAKGRAAGPLPETLRIIRRLWAAITRGNNLNRSV